MDDDDPWGDLSDDSDDLGPATAAQFHGSDSEASGSASGSEGDDDGDGDEDEAAMGTMDAEMAEMRRLLSNTEYERTSEAAAAATAAAATAGPAAGPAAAPHLQAVGECLRANRQLQEQIRQQLARLDGARRANVAAFAEWQQDHRRVQQTDKAMRRAQGKKGDSKLERTNRYRHGSTTYFGSRGAAASGSATEPRAAALADRRVLRGVVPLGYPSSKWSKEETTKLRKVMRQWCQQRRAAVLLARDTDGAAESQVCPRATTLPSLLLPPPAPPLRGCSPCAERWAGCFARRAMSGRRQRWARWS